jgi:hypothetical protein
MTSQGHFITQFKLLNPGQQENRIISLINHTQTEILGSKEISDKIVADTPGEIWIDDYTICSINLHHPRGILARATFTVVCGEHFFGHVVLSGKISVLIDSYGDVQITKLAAHAVPPWDQDSRPAEWEARTEPDRHASWTRRCCDCGQYYESSYETRDLVACPECLERNRANRERQKDNQAPATIPPSDWSNSILEFCKICQKPYKATLTGTVAPKTCPECLHRAPSAMPSPSDPAPALRLDDHPH